MGFVRFLRLLLYLLAAIGGGFLLLRFLLPWMSPFLLAFSLAALMGTALTERVSE